FGAVSSLLCAQQNQFLYEYRYIPDSTRKDNVLTDLMVLKQGNHKSEFYSLDIYLSDSTLLAECKKGVFAMPTSKSLISDKIGKYKNTKHLDYITILSNTRYVVKQEVELKWNLLPEFDKVLNYKVQKATTQFGGRSWIAWFSTDISLQDGPYKFSGLPGLILKIQDVGLNHILELKGVKNTDDKT